MDIFQRSIHSNVKQVDEDHFLVTSQLLDLEHSFHLEMRVRVSDGLIESASATMSKAPFDRCAPAAGKVAGLAGHKIGRGIMSALSDTMGGPRGCAHLTELANDAIRLIAMLRTGTNVEYWDRSRRTLSEEEVIARSKPLLKNSCMVFADDS